MKGGAGAKSVVSGCTLTVFVLGMGNLVEGFSAPVLDVDLPAGSSGNWLNLHLAICRPPQVSVK
jgi:hypothetical protein